MSSVRNIVVAGAFAVCLVAVTSRTWAQYAEGLERYNAGEYSAAAEILASLVEQSPEHARGRYLLGLCFQKLGKYEEAREQLGEVVQARPEDGKAHTNLARALLKLNACEEAIAAASRGVSLLGDSGAYNVLGLAQMAGKLYEEADRAFAKAVVLDPSNAWAHNNRAYAAILRFRSDPGSLPAETGDWINRALELDPENVVFIRNRDYILGALRK